MGTEDAEGEDARTDADDSGTDAEAVADADGSGADAGPAAPTHGDLWDVLGCKWTYHVVQRLSEGDAGFNELVGDIEGLPANTLSVRLKALGEHAIVERTVEEAATPPSVTYSLTGKGEELAALLARIESLDRRHD